VSYNLKSSRQKELLQRTFDDASMGYDCGELRFFAESSKYITSEIMLSGFETVLDVATGTGYSALEIARKLPNGKVIGIDFSSGMLDRAREKMQLHGIDNVEFIKMDMEELEFPAKHFDVAVCSFGVFFVENMDGLLRGIKEKVKNGGKVVVSTFSEKSLSPLADLFLDRLRKYGLEIPPMPSKRVSTKEQCSNLFKKAGFKKINIVEKNLGYFLKNSDDWWGLIQGAAFRGFVNRLPEKDIALFKEEHLSEVENLRTENGIWLEVNVLYSIGIKKD
jgi:ubiquinone/menaquinone biosynthesis C-methylase UbiE